MRQKDDCMIFYLLNLSEMREGPLTFQGRGLKSQVNKANRLHYKLDHYEPSAICIVFVMTVTLATFCPTRPDTKEWKLRLNANKVH